MHACMHNVGSDCQKGRSESEISDPIQNRVLHDLVYTTLLYIQAWNSISSPPPLKIGALWNPEFRQAKCHASFLTWRFASRWIRTLPTSQFVILQILVNKEARPRSSLFTLTCCFVDLFLTVDDSKDEDISTRTTAAEQFFCLSCAAVPAPANKFVIRRQSQV